MNTFKVGDIVELDKTHRDYSAHSKIPALMGNLKITDIYPSHGWVYFDGTWDNSDGGGWFPERFRLVEQVHQVEVAVDTEPPQSMTKPMKKSHAWVTIEKSSGKVTSMRTTRKAIRFQQKLNRKLDKGTVIRKITYEIV